MLPHSSKTILKRERGGVESFRGGAYEGGLGGKKDNWKTVGIKGEGYPEKKEVLKWQDSFKAR
jgi:hypothetical protein